MRVKTSPKGQRIFAIFTRLAHLERCLAANVDLQGMMSRFDDAVAGRRRTIDLRVNIIRGHRAGIQKQIPLHAAAQFRQREFADLTGAVEDHDHVSPQAFGVVGSTRSGNVGHHRQFVLSPVQRFAVFAVPGNVGNHAAIHGLAGQILATSQGRLVAAELNQCSNEPRQIRVLFHQSPVKPADVVILAIGVVVTFLRAANFVTADDHRHTLAEQQRTKHVADLSRPNRVDRFLSRGSFCAVVVADVVVVTITIIFTVFGVVFLFVRNQIVHREAVVAGDEIDAAKRWASGVLVQIAAAGKSGREGTQCSAVATPESSHVVAVTAVPLCPAMISKRADLVGTGGVPGLRDDLRVRQQRILGDDFDHRWIGNQVAGPVAAQNAGQIEAESVDVVVVDPVTQAMEDHLADHRMVTVQSVAATAVVGKVLTLTEDVIDLVFQSLEGQRRSLFVAFAGVIEDDVQDHFDTGGVKRFDHLLEFADLRTRASNRAA